MSLIKETVIQGAVIQETVIQETVIQGTVYGTLMNFACEHRALASQMIEAPYKGAPVAPVLYIKTANTFSDYGANITLPSHAPSVQVRASVGLIMGDAGVVDKLVLLNDLTVPHASFYRPPVKSKCIDGFLGIAQHAIAITDLSRLDGLQISVSINTVMVQTIHLSQMIRSPAQLLAEVRDFIDLQAGDVLMIGSPFNAPLAKVDDHIAISAPGFASVSNRLVAQS